MPPAFLLLVLLLCLPAALAQDTRAVLNKYVTEFATRVQQQKSISLEGDLTILGQRGDTPGRVLSQAKLRYAVAPGGKSLLYLKPAENDEYTLVSNGEKSWAYVPRLKQYTEESGALLEQSDNNDEEEAKSDSERDLSESFVRLLLPSIAELVRTAEAADLADPVEVRYEGKKDKWPVVRIMSKELQPGWRRLTEFAIDPATGRVGRIVLADVTRENNVRTVIRSEFQLTRCSIGEPVPDSTFAFDPPKNAKLVEAVPIPGQTGSFLLNKPAPDFEAKTLDGRPVRLSELRGTTVLLNFWASWCGPCRRELPALADVYDKYKNKGLLILGVNDEGKSIAKEFDKRIGLNFETLDDSSLKLHKAYRVRSIPTIFLIDKEGKIVRFARGARDEAGLKAMLQAAGL